jgi:hypothetical protein
MPINAAPDRARRRMLKMSTYQGFCSCQNCGAQAHVFTNKNGLAYYKCGPCSVKVEHFNMRKSQAFLSTITKHIDPDEQAPAVAPEKSGKLPEPPVKAKPKKPGFFDGLNIG